MSILTVDNLNKAFGKDKVYLVIPSKKSVAVKDVSFTIERGEALGLVGGSGSGKSTVAKIVLGLLRPNKGRVLFDGMPVLKLKRGQRADFRRQTQIVFQDPLASLSPRLKAHQSIVEPLEVHLKVNSVEIRRRVLELMDEVGLDGSHAERYPHQLSGGERQRVCIARALALRPKLIVLDEPVTALDVSIRAQVLNLLADLRRQYGLSYLFITHDLATVRHVCDRLAVMKEGEIVETGTTDEIFNIPQNNYTRQLIDAIPAPIPRRVG